MSEHTPGPWQWSDGLDNALVNPELLKRWVESNYAKALWPFVLQGEWHNDSTAGIACEREADARLIASAPDLLNACEVALHDRMYKDWPDVAELLMAAIAKAKGDAEKDRSLKP